MSLFCGVQENRFCTSVVLFVMVRVMLSHNFLLHDWRWIHHTIHLLMEQREAGRQSLMC